MKNKKAVYNDYLENTNISATEDVIEARNQNNDALQEYINAISEFEWMNGFRYAMQMMKGGNANE